MDININKIYAPDMPMGLTGVCDCLKEPLEQPQAAFLDIALAKNQAAKDYFYGLPESAQTRIIEHTHMIQSKDEMQAFADSLVKTGNMF